MAKRSIFGTIFGDLLRSHEITNLGKLLCAEFELILFEMNAGEWGDTLSLDLIADHLNKNPEHILREIKKLQRNELVREFYDIEVIRRGSNFRSEVLITKKVINKLFLTDRTEETTQDLFMQTAAYVIQKNKWVKYSVQKLLALTKAADSNELLKGVLYVNAKQRRGLVDNFIPYLKSCFDERGRFKYDLINNLTSIHQKQYIPRAVDPFAYIVSKEYEKQLKELLKRRNCQVHYFIDSVYAVIYSITEAGKERIIWKLLKEEKIPLLDIKLVGEMPKTYVSKKLKISLDHEDENPEPEPERGAA
ncbi:MAG: hypothetical protein IT279_11190 [Ignavibacteriaceae bacterium]|nr:hypothetical protein [Ignavibacteriaceae bacterium]